jgi:hypothetical protein
MIQAVVTASQPQPQSTQSAGPVRYLMFCSISIFLLASLVAVGDPSVLLVQISRECTPPYLSTGISNLLQPAQAEVVLGQLSTYLASWSTTIIMALVKYIQYCHAHLTVTADISDVTQSITTFFIYIRMSTFIISL